MDEIQHLVRSYGAQKIIFLDDHALASRSRMRAICEKLIEQNLEVALGCLATPVSYDPITFELMFRAGFRWVHFGAESGSDRVLKRLNKNSSAKMLRHCIRGARELGFRVRTSWILDAPESDAEDFDATEQLLLETEPEEVRAHFLSLRAGSALTETIAPGNSANGNVATQQYLHSGRPQLGLQNYSQELLMNKISDLTQRLSQRGYQVVRTPEAWQDLAKTSPQRNLRFISFCPARYGIGWVL